MKVLVFIGLIFSQVSWASAVSLKALNKSVIQSAHEVFLTEGERASCGGEVSDLKILFQDKNSVSVSFESTFSKDNCLTIDRTTCTGRYGLGVNSDGYLKELLLDCGDAFSDRDVQND